MPIRRWLGWCAICPDCEKEVELGGDVTAWPEKWMVKESLCIQQGETIDQTIREICGCERRKEAKP